MLNNIKYTVDKHTVKKCMVMNSKKWSIKIYSNIEYVDNVCYGFIIFFTYSLYALPYFKYVSFVVDKFTKYNKVLFFFCFHKFKEVSLLYYDRYVFLMLKRVLKNEKYQEAPNCLLEGGQIWWELMIVITLIYIVIINNT